MGAQAPRRATGEPEEVAIADNVIQGKLKKPTPDGRTRVLTTRVDPVLAKDLAQYDVRFTGADEAKDELREVVGFPKEPVRLGRLGGSPPWRGV